MTESPKSEGLESNSDDESLSWQDELQSNRIRITILVEYNRLSPYLKAYAIFDQEDDEEIKNQHLYPTNSRKMNAVIDKLLRKGEKNYKKFLDAVACLNKNLYDSIVNPTEDQVPVSGIPSDDRPFPHDQLQNELLDLLLQRYEAIKMECENLRKKVDMSNRDVEDKTRELSQLQLTIQEMKTRIDRYESMERDMAALKDVLDHVKTENHKFCMRLLDKTEENARIKERIMAMRIEMDKKENDLRKANRAVDSERQASFRLKRRIQEGPSQRYVSELLKEIEELKIQLAQSKESSFSMDSDVDTRIQMLKSDKEEAIQMCSEASEKLNKLREEFNDTEAARDKYLDENERLRLQIDALTDDCDMFRNRRDAVWQQLQEVEKEKDQLMKERNEAQMSAQNHMDEKTKYRAEIRKLEETLDEKSRLLREKEDVIRKREKIWQQISTLSIEQLPNQFRDRLHNIKHYDEYNVESEFGKSINNSNIDIGPDNIFPEVPLAKNYGKNCGDICHQQQQADKSRLPKRRRPVNKMGRQNRSNDTPSRTSSTDSEHQRTKYSDHQIMIEVEAKMLRECVTLIGGNAKGIFIHEIVESYHSAYAATLLRPGLQLVKIRKPQAKPFEVTNWTLEFAYDFIAELQGTLVLLLENKPTEYRELIDASGYVRLKGDSFYVRANFNWHEDDMLNFKQCEVIHVVNTKPHKAMRWEACKIDPYNGNDASKAKEIPSVKYCQNVLQANQVTRKQRTQSEPSILLIPEYKDNRMQQSSCTVKRTKPSLMSLITGKLEDGIQKCTDSTTSSRSLYTIVKFNEKRRNVPRPCILLPQNFSGGLAKELVSTSNPLTFCFPKTEIKSCPSADMRHRIYDRHIVSFRSISENVHEIVRTESVRLAAEQGKHCILDINDKCISVKEYLRLLQDEDIYPIVLLLKVQTKKTSKILNPHEKAKHGVLIKEAMLIEEQLKRLACNFVPVNLERCTKLEDAVQVVTEKVADEMNRILWIEDGDLMLM